MADNIAIVKRLVDEVWNAGRYEIVGEVMAQTSVMHDPLAGDIRGPDAFAEFARTFRTGFPDLVFTIDDAVTARDEVYMRWTTKGTHKGALLGMAPTNRRAVVGGMTVNLFKGNKIVEAWNTWDTLSLLQQLGYLPTTDKITSGSLATRNY